jgi:hypothetical protein
VNGEVRCLCHALKCIVMLGYLGISTKMVGWHFEVHHQSWSWITLPLEHVKSRVCTESAVLLEGDHCCIVWRFAGYSRLMSVNIRFTSRVDLLRILAPRERVGIDPSISPPLALSVHWSAPLPLIDSSTWLLSLKHLSTIIQRW